jgi:hypothetical protein
MLYQTLGSTPRLLSPGNNATSVVLLHKTALYPIRDPLSSDIGKPAFKTAKLHGSIHVYHSNIVYLQKTFLPPKLGEADPGGLGAGPQETNQTAGELGLAE